MSYIKIKILNALLFLALATSVNSFNIQSINNGFILTSNKTGNLFGFSMTFHEKNGEKSLIVDAPTKPNQNSSKQQKLNQQNNLYKCKLQINPLKSVCANLNITFDAPDDVIYFCDFENCLFDQVLMDDFNWTRSNKATPSRNTGPTKDHTFENFPCDPRDITVLPVADSTNGTSGYFLFIEASMQNLKFPRSAIVATPTQPATLGDCLRFWYHMYGEEIASLNIYVQTSHIGMVMVWTKSGNKGNKWIEGYVTVISERPYKILFEGIRESWKGDIGIDDVMIQKGQCKEDLAGIIGSVGSTLTTNPSTMEILTCNPNWKFNCSGQLHASGACYFLNENLTTDIRSIITPFKKQVCSTTLVDIAFIIDSSTSVSKSDFDFIKMWLRNVISSLPIGPGLAQVGIMIYSGTPTIRFYLNKYHKIEDLRKAIENMNFTGGSTNTGQAIDEAAKEIFLIENGMRPTAKHVAIVMTDGKSQDNVTEPSKKAKEAGITLFAIGVGNADKEELRTITSDPDKYLFTIGDYKALGEIKNALQESIASLESQGKTTTTEQGMAGFSALFHGEVAIIGSPGLNDWSGGYSAYSISKKEKKQASSRSTHTFNELLQDARALQSENNCNETDSKNTFSHQPFTDRPTASSHGNLQTSAFLLIEGSGAFFNQSQESANNRELNLATSCNTTTFETNFPNDNEELESYAYFGYSVTSGRFMNSKVIDLGFGAPRAGSYGMVFIVRHNNTQEKNYRMSPLVNNPKLMDWYKSDQMGSYFGFTLCATDTNGDGIDEIIVGAPLWMGRQADEGRVFVFVSELNESSDSIIRKKLILDGSQMHNARFGYSLATPGDLNLDGFNDVVIGAPSNNNGAVYIYYGRPDKGISFDKYQVILAKESKTKLAYFGFSVLSNFDLDSNGYNDVALSAPGDAKVVILFSRPVIHMDVKFVSIPSTLNNSDLNLDKHDKLYMCDRNTTDLCITLETCFSAFGRNVSENITLAYRLLVDVRVNENKRRGRVLNPVGEINLKLNKIKCKKFITRLKLPIRQQLTPLISTFHYELSKQTFPLGLSPVLDIFDAEEKSVAISFFNSCHDDVCFADLSLTCSVIGDSDHFTVPTVIIGSDQVLTLNLNLTNQMDAAYDVEFDVTFPNSVYFIQSLPFSKKDGLCIENEYLISDLTEVSNGSYLLHSNELDRQRIRFILKNPVMLHYETCFFLLQFGFQDTFNGGSLNLNFQALTNSVENNWFDNNCNLSLNVNFEAEVELHGSSLKDYVQFSKENTSSTTSKDIGPDIFHNWTLSNVGPSAIPTLNMNVQWPILTKSKHPVLSLINARCYPDSACACQYVTSATIHNTTNQTSSTIEQSSVEFSEYSESNFEIDSRTKERFRMISMDCSKQESRIFCASLNCRFTKLLVLQSITLQLHFRLWQKTLIKGKVWKVVLVSTAEMSTQLSPYIVNSNGKSSYNLSEKIKTEALNGDFVFTEDKGAENNFEIWIILVAVTLGLLVLIMFVIGLYKLGFFERKYKQRLEEELQWTHTYQHTYAGQEDLHEDERLNERIRLTTFQQPS